MLQPNYTAVPEIKKIMLLDDYRIIYGNVEIVAPKYFMSDGASIPWYGQRVTYTPFHPLCIGPAIIHDWLDLNHQVDFETAAQILYDLLILNEANKTKAKIIYQSVLMGGRQFWPWTEQDKKNLMLLYIMCKKSPRFDDYCFPMDAIK